MGITFRGSPTCESRLILFDPVWDADARKEHNTNEHANRGKAQVTAT